MGFIRHLAACLIVYAVFPVLSIAGFALWGISLQTGYAAGQVFGVVFGGIFGVMWLAFVLVWAEERKTTRRPIGYRY